LVIRVVVRIQIYGSYIIQEDNHNTPVSMCINNWCNTPVSTKYSCVNQNN